jgi:hypothetical protein
MLLVRVELVPIGDGNVDEFVMETRTTLVRIRKLLQQKFYTKHKMVLLKELRLLKIGLTVYLLNLHEPVQMETYHEK